MKTGFNLEDALNDFRLPFSRRKEFSFTPRKKHITATKNTRGLDWEREDESLMLKMFMLLYADDTTICSESAEGLHQALDALSDYCDKWSLRVNVDKTKVVVFSRGKIRKMPTIKYKGRSLEVVFEFQYLGVCFNYNNKFNLAQKSLYDKASRAMFGLLKKCRKLMLPLDIQTGLFDR